MGLVICWFHLRCSLNNGFTLHQTHAIFHGTFVAKWTSVFILAITFSVSYSIIILLQNNHGIFSAPELRTHVDIRLPLWHIATIFESGDDFYSRDRGRFHIFFALFKRIINPEYTNLLLFFWRKCFVSLLSSIRIFFIHIAHSQILSLIHDCWLFHCICSTHTGILGRICISLRILEELFVIIVKTLGKICLRLSFLQIKGHLFRRLFFFYRSQFFQRGFFACCGSSRGCRSRICIRGICL